MIIQHPDGRQECIPLPTALAYWGGRLRLSLANVWDSYAHRAAAGAEQCSQCANDLAQLIVQCQDAVAQPAECKTGC